MDDLISRQAVLENAFAIYTHECGLVEVVGVATIKDLPSVKLQPCEDAISKKVVLDMLEDINAETEGVGFYYEHYVDYIKALPPVKPQTGHWEMPVQDDGMSDPIYYQVRCSKCGFDLDPQTWHMELHQYGADKYCPKCGAKMVEPQERSEE